MNKKDYNIIIYIGVIICAAIIILDTDIRMLRIICSSVIGMHLVLIIYALYKRFNASKKV